MISALRVDAWRTRVLAAALAFACAVLPWPSFADAARVRISHGHGLLYLPLMVMRDQGLVEKHAKAMGFEATIDWHVVDGGDAISAGMLAGRLDIAGIGAPGFISLWSETRGKRNETIGLGALSTSSLWLNSNRPGLKTLRDLGPNDRIAVPGVKTSLPAVVLQMAAAETFGDAQYSRLDRWTVAMPHPEAMARLIGGKPPITAHFASPPFSHEEVDEPHIHRVFNSSEMLGNITLDVVVATRSFVDANPRLVDAFLEAQDEANTLIAKNPKRAGEIFARIARIDGVEPREIEKILDDPNTQFTTLPNGVMRYARFMARSGAIKRSPASWTELFIPRLHQRAGS